jgi:Tfp pilus assembly protein PilN
VVKKIQIMSLKASWAKVAPQSKDAVAVKAEIKDLNNKIMAMKGFLTRKVIVTELLSSLNAAVPKGLWLERLSLTTEGGLVLQGSVVSLTQNEMTIIGKFLQEIKSNKTFAELFSKIDLNSVQRRTIKTFDVVDFVVLGELKK